MNNGVFTESEAKKTKSIARARIHVERANARLNDFKILTFIPYYLRCYADVIFQLCAALVNVQFSRGVREQSLSNLSTKRNVCLLSVNNYVHYMIYDIFHHMIYDELVE